MSGTGGAVARGVAWMLLARIADRLGGILSIAIIARHLTPDDFGVFHMALSVIALVELMSTFAFDWALIRHPDPKREHFDTAFTIQLLIALVVSVVVIAIAHPFAVYYRTPALVEPVMVLAMSPLIAALNNLAPAHLRRELRFERDFWRMTLARLFSVVIGIALAVALQSYWALIIAALIGKAASNALGFLLHPYRPRLGLSKWRELLGYSMWVQAAVMIEGMKSRLSDLIVGRQLGAHSLAVYNMSNEVASLPQSEFVGAVNSAVFSKYSQVQNDREQVRAVYLEVFALTVLIGLPIACGLAFTAPGLVRVMLGPAWSGVADIIPVVAFAAFANALAVNSGFVLMATGKLFLQTWLSGASVIALVPLLLIATASQGAIGAAWAYTAVSLAMLPAHLIVMGFVIAVRPAEILGRSWRSVAASVSMCAVLANMPPLSMTMSAIEAACGILQLAAVGSAIYIAVVGSTWIASGRPASVERTLIDVIADILAHIRSRLAGR